jgi:hypothetical protein
MGNSRIQFRRGKAAFWEDANPTLHPGEPGFETDTKKYKIGDGATPWRELEYIGYVPSVGVEPVDDLDDLVSVSDADLLAHIQDSTPHPVYDDGPSLFLLYQNAKV